jgi:hypothetical protein
VLSDDEEFVRSLNYGYGGFSRSLPRIEDLQSRSDLIPFLKGVIASGQSEEISESSSDLTLHKGVTASGQSEDTLKALDRCYKKGWLQAELLANGKRVYIFPSKLHERFAKILLSSNVQEFPQDRFSSVRQLCFEAIRKFSPALLSSTKPALRAGAVVPPEEAQYTQELFRACYHILGQKLFLTSEWSGTSSNGRVDFYIKPVKWAIECLRDGSDLLEHIERFQPGGTYYPWIVSGEIQDYIILDFRTSKPTKIRDDAPFLYSVVFSKDYTGYEIYDAKLNLVVERVALLNSKD